MTNNDEDVPVRIGGVEVGTARIDEDGGIDLTMKPNQFGRDIYTGTQAGIVTGITIRPVRRTTLDPLSDGSNVRPLRAVQDSPPNDTDAAPKK